MHCYFQEGACNVLTPFMDILRDAGVTSEELNDCAACRLCMTRYVNLYGNFHSPLENSMNQ